ncbi:hypothetical protein BTA35_0200340 [Oceanospirillum linum]|uniref:Bacterial surface antigen (D15) domain-containing protein n=1 Tax=Oceanospirillum linum TaxID=966 RepID=A0A1T1HEA6_OCELI|nr:hypothetical protein BTA35_0200340 [Oceanospirillum linum]
MSVHPKDIAVIIPKEPFRLLTFCLVMMIGLSCVLMSTQVKAERIIIPVAFSTPDTGFAGGAAVIWAIPNPEAGENKKDTVSAFGYLSQKGQVMLALSSSLYRSEGSMLLEPSVAFGKSVSTSHGIGSLSRTGSEESYEAEFVRLNFMAGWRILKDSYFGPAMSLQHRKYTDLSDARELKDYLAGNNEKMQSTRLGLGFQLKRDTRDNSFYSQKGVFSEAEFLTFDTSWGSDYNFNLFGLEHRRFIPLNSRSVLAIQGKIKAASGHVPYDQMPAVGGAQSIRGLLQDRYRDELALSSQVEWRRILTDKWGMAVFSGFGDVFPSFDQVRASELKYALGVGGRYALGQKQRVNLRLDFGYSDALGDAEADGFNVYFQVGEAF